MAFTTWPATLAPGTPNMERHARQVSRIRAPRHHEAPPRRQAHATPRGRITGPSYSGQTQGSTKRPGCLIFFEKPGGGMQPAEPIANLQHRF
jgi:hypothetical protein